MAHISPDDWQRLEPFFDALLDLDPDQRIAWLNDQAELSDMDRGQLKDLLSAHESDGGQLDTPLPQSAAHLVAESMVDPLVGTTLGAFQVVEEIGRGGMGVVYLGRRTDGEFEQEVVIKVLRLGIDSEDSRGRFLQERQILADLDHPAIVRLLDGGFTSDGRPYIVMNQIVGQRIDTFCDQRQLEILARVRLFLGVIEAVDYAHRNLVIHRDLKPSNIWVDEEGKVHLLDFGIAKIVSEDGDSGLTVSRQRMMTPEYASPEQIRQDKVTTTSDVYQLGILLYRLLTGQYPYSLDGQSALEMEKRICGDDPVPASRAATTTANPRASATNEKTEQDAIFENRGTNATRLRKILKGDLDLILQKALRKEPERRYQSARELREDLIRWLSGDRILARPDSIGYQSRRFVRRHPLVVALLGLTVIGSLSFTSFHVNRITTERNLAQAESVQRMEIADFLVNLLKVPDPTAAQGREITARELLEVSSERIEEGLSDVPTKIRLYEVVGKVAQNLGIYEQAGPALARAVDHTAELYGERSLETAAAQIKFAEMLRLAQMYEDAIGPAEEALSIRHELLPPGHVDIGWALKMVAVILRGQREYERAEKEYREAAEILNAQLPVDDPKRTTVQIDLAYVLRTVGKAEEAEALYRQALPVMRNRPDEFRAELPGALNNLAFLLRNKGQFAEAEALYREAITLSENHHGKAHPSTLMFRNNLAGVLNSQGKTDETRQELKTIVGMQTHLAGAEHWQTGTAYRSLGYFLLSTGDPAAALPELRAAHGIFEIALGPDHLWTAATAMQLALCLHQLGDEPESSAWWQQARPVLDTEKAKADRNVQFVLQQLMDLTDAFDEPWPQRLSSLIAVENQEK